MRRAILAVLFFLFATISALVVHEGAHAVAAIAFGGTVDQIVVIPGIQLVPDLKWFGGMQLLDLPQ